MPAAANPALDPDALVHRAFQRFEDTVERGDRRLFTNTELSDVRDAASAIENKLAAEQNSRALGRVSRLLRGLEHYSGPLGVICGTKELAWIWV
jgi:hypothetical protein